jgi:ribosome-associated protein
MSERLQVNRRVAIPIDEIVIRSTRSSGPGGQHANVTDSRIEVAFDVRASATLRDREKELLIERAGPIVRAVAQDHRGQLRNRELALERLAQKLATGLYVQPHRTKTKPTRGAKERRLKAKRQGAERKKGRQRPSTDD